MPFPRRASLFVALALAPSAGAEAGTGFPTLSVPSHATWFEPTTAVPSRCLSLSELTSNRPSPSRSQVKCGLDMFWNDAAVQYKDVPLFGNPPGGPEGLENPGPLGLFSGAPGDPVVANVNARAWGDFTGAGKGDASNLDTYTWVFGDSSVPFPIEVIDPNLDSDDEGLTDHVGRDRDRRAARRRPAGRGAGRKDARGARRRRGAPPPASSGPGPR